MEIQVGFNWCDRLFTSLLCWWSVLFRHGVKTQVLVFSACHSIPFCPSGCPWRKRKMFSDTLTWVSSSSDTSADGPSCILLASLFRRSETSESLWHHKGPWWFSCISVNARNQVFQISWGKSGRSDKASILEFSVVVFFAGGTANALLARNLFRDFFSFLVINRARLRNWHKMKNKTLGKNMESVA